MVLLLKSGNFLVPNILIIQTKSVYSIFHISVILKLRTEPYLYLTFLTLSLWRLSIHYFIDISKFVFNWSFIIISFRLWNAIRNSNAVLFYLSQWIILKGHDLHYTNIGETSFCHLDKMMATILRECISLSLFFLHG